jgi:hypothetical protein
MRSVVLLPCLALLLCCLRLSAESSSSSVFMTLDGNRVEPSEAHSVPLLKGVVDSKRRNELLLQLRFAQSELSPDSTGRWGSARRNSRHYRQPHRFASADDLANNAPPLLPVDPLASLPSPHERDSEPLQVQILSQKRLATYYGEIRIGGQAFKGGTFC